MGKADPKKDYYAALGVPPDADLDTIKKRFRVLALKVHPDRNFGKGKEVTEKFVEVQEAYEVLSDQDQREQYDNDRARYIRKTQPESFPFKRAQTTKVPPPNPAFQSTAKSRNASVDRSQFTNPRTKPSSTSAEKFAPFTRAAPQPWDRAKYEQATAQQEALRNFQSMRGQAPPQPPRPGRAPTAPKSNNPATSPEYTHANIPSPGFPGLSRTHSAPRRPGFSPAVPGNDEPQAKSAYAYVHRERDRPQSYQNTTSQPPTPTSPLGYPPRTPGDNLKPTKSSSGLDEGQRPTFGRTPSRYATSTGEKTNINGSGIGRSASVRQSPASRGFGEHGPFGMRAQASQEFKQPPPRHHSASPKLRPSRDVRFEFSASETSSSEDDAVPRRPRRKAVPKRSRPYPTERTTSNDPALMGQFPDKNYNRIVDDNQYNFPPPEMRSAPHINPSNGMASPWVDLADGMRATGLGDEHQEFPRPSRPTSNLHESSHDSHSKQETHQAPFSASDWDAKFADGENIFAPNEQDRKSPTKTSRTRQTGKTKGTSSHADWDDDISPTTVTGQKSGPEAPPQNATSPKGTFSMDGWAENLKSPGSASMPSTNSPDKNPHVSSVEDEENLKEPASANAPDPMDIDSSGTENSRPIPSIRVEPGSRRTSAHGVDLSDLAETFPLKPSADGLNSLSSDLAGSLPFNSRSADQVQLSAPSGAALRGMNLPKPPKTIIAPEQITQESWESYWKKMQQYMRDWSMFNAKMIHHFRLRQEQVDHDMYHNWVMGEGEGANAQDIDGSDITSPPGSAGGEHPHKHAKAGYHTYMQWLDQDALCRNWWDSAFEQHRECLTELGRMRRTVKAIRDRQ